MSRLPTDIIPIAGTFADAAALAVGLASSTGMMIAFFDIAGESRNSQSAS